MKYLNNINKLTNILLKKYYFRYDREEAKKKKLINEFLEKDIIIKFIESFNLIKDKLIVHNEISYNCIIISTHYKWEKPYEYNKDSTLNYFLVDDGEKGGGMFLASAYEKMIGW